MHQQIDKKHKYILLIILFLFLSTISNLKISKNLNNFSNIKDLKVIGLSDNLNQKIKKKISFLLNKNIFFISEDFIKENLNEYQYLESFDVFKVFPSKIIINLKQTTYLANTIKGNKKYILGSNGKLIDNKMANINLPNIFGDFSNKNFISFYNIIMNSEFNYNEIKNIFYFKNGRWDIETNFGVIIKLPKNYIKKSLDNAHNIVKNSKINYKVIDLRVTNQVILSNE